MSGTKNIFWPKKAVLGFFRLLLGTVICLKVTINFTKNIFWPKNLPELKILAQNYPLV